MSRPNAALALPPGDRDEAVAATPEPAEAAAVGRKPASRAEELGEQCATLVARVARLKRDGKPFAEERGKLAWARLSQLRAEIDEATGGKEAA